MVGSDVVGAARAEVSATDPDLFCAPLSGGGRVAVTHQGRVHGEDRALVELIGQSNRRFHRLGVGHDQRGVAPARFAERFGFGDGAC